VALRVWQDYAQFQAGCNQRGARTTSRRGRASAERPALDLTRVVSAPAAIGPAYQWMDLARAYDIIRETLDAYLRQG
jgi:hypothetical protein